MAITRLGGANAITGTLPAANINDTSIGNITALPAAIATGKVLQVVTAIKTDTTSSSSLTMVDISSLSVSITPSSASNKILVMCSFCWGADNNSSPKFKLTGGNTSTYVGDAAGDRQRVAYYAADDYFNGASNAGNETAFMGFLNYLDSPATTSSTTYKLQGSTDNNGSFHINRTGADVNSSSEGGRSASSIIVMEIEG
jgi:hypothetical protein